MEKNSTTPKDIFIAEEEKTLSWTEVQSSFEKTFGSEVYSSWLKNIKLIKEYNDYLVLGVPTRFFRDWIVSRYLDKILEQLKIFKLSINRIEFKILEETKTLGSETFKIDDFKKVTEIKDSILNYNRLNPNLNFDNFVEGSSNKIALSSSKKICKQISRYNPPLYLWRK
jgi:ATPase involved in DNA replication initiation